MKKKIKKLWQNKLLKNYTILSLSFLLLEVGFRFLAGISIFTWSFVRIILGINIISLVISYLLSFTRPVIAKILNILIILIASIYSMAQLGFLNFLGVFASVQTTSQLGAVKEYIGDFFASFKWQYYLLSIVFILVLLYYLLLDKKITKDLPKKILTKKEVLKRVSPIFLIVLLSLTYFGTLKLKFMQNTYQAINTYQLFKKPTNPSTSVSEFGILSFALLDIKEDLFPGKEISTSINYNAANVKSSFTKEEQTVVDNNIWKNIIDNETNENYNTLNKYFINNKVTKTNEYSSVLKGKNVIVLMLESVNDIILNKEYYPNIWKLYNEGLTWDNNYSPRNSCSTGNNEMSGMTGLYSIYNNCTANIYEDNTYSESIFNLFKNAGYETNSLHDNYDEFYNRNIIHKNMGSDNFYDINSLNIPYGTGYGDWANDEDFIDAYFKILDEKTSDKPFMSWLTTVSSHQPYTKGCQFGDLYNSLFPEEYSVKVKNYMSKLKVVDNAIGKLVSGLEKRDLLEDTVIVLYGDHYPYAIPTDELNMVLDYDTSIDNNTEQVPFIIYNKELKGKKFSDYTSYVNITPTIANLLGLKYDSRLYFGEDILNDDYESLVIFADGSWKNEIAFYDASKNDIKYYTQKVYSDEEILAINERVSLKLNMSSLAIRVNYFSYLEDKLNKNTTSTID